MRTGSQDLEYMLKALTSGVRNINVVVSLGTHHSSPAGSLETNWRIATVAARKQRVRLALGERVDYSMFGGPITGHVWPLHSKDEAALLVADLSPAQLAAAPALLAELQKKGWSDLTAAIAAKL